MEATTNDEVAVVFRAWKNDGQVIALFPDLPGDNNPSTCMCYEHTGQHGVADTGIARGTDTRAATEAEYAPLKRELEGLGYTLLVQSKFPSAAHLKRRRQLGVLWR